MVSTWMGDHSGVEVDAVVKNTVKSQEWRNEASNKHSCSKKKLHFVYFKQLHIIVIKKYYELESKSFIFF